MAKSVVYRSANSILNVLSHEENFSPEVNELLTIYEKKSSLRNTERKNPFIVFEGLDGSGKSTIIKIINESIEGKQVSTPPECIRHLRHNFDEKPAELKSAFYSLGNYIAAEEIKDMLKESTVLVDRFWHSTCASALARHAGNVLNLPPTGSELYQWPDDLLKPDAVIFLHVSEDKRIERLSRRASYTAEEDKLKNDNDFRNAFITAFKRMNDPPVTTIISNKRPKAVTEFTLSRLINMGLALEFVKH